jgi:hypothetical protein
MQNNYIESKALMKDSQNFDEPDSLTKNYLTAKKNGPLAELEGNQFKLLITRVISVEGTIDSK